MTLTVGSLFAGIGGNDLGLERAGMRTLWQVELDPWCRRVLAKHWPDVERFEDVREVGAHNLSPVDLIAGGFPCQDISIAGRAAGIGGARSGLWGEFARIVRELRPRYVLVENSPVLTSRGMDVVLGDLAASGYDAEWDCVPAAAVGAPHLRDRIWIVASRPEQPRPLADSDDGGSRDQVQAGRDASRDGCPDVADDDREGRTLVQGRCKVPEGAWDRAADRGGWSGRGSHDWRSEPPVGRVVDGLPGRVDRLRGLGNSVVPQIVEEIGRRIVAWEEAMKSGCQ